MGRRRQKGRPVNGILLLDKPLGVGSTEALQAVKDLYQARKAGHTGSLDRLASGLLPICFGEATKLSGFLLNADKRYAATFRLGVVTTTGDAEGKIVSEGPVPKLTERKVEKILERFTGPIEQVPPMYSALKVQGQRLYQLAHQGITVERAPRPVEIYRFELLALRPDAMDVEVSCSKGTYIRTLAEDVGEVIGCGASVSRLRRTGAGPFHARDMHTMEALECLAAEEPRSELDGLLLPMEDAVAQWPRVNLPEPVAFYLKRGQPVLVPHAPTEGWVRIFAGERVFVGVGEVLDDGRIAPRRLVNG